MRSTPSRSRTSFFGRVGILYLCFSFGCSHGNRSQPKKDPPMIELPSDAEGLLRLAENEQLRLRDRADAVERLGELKEGGEVVDRLIRLLPGRDDLLRGSIIEALGEIGDPRALPVLEKLECNDGKNNAALKHAVKQLQ